MTRIFGIGLMAALVAQSFLAEAQQAIGPVRFPAEAVPFTRPGNLKQTILFKPSVGTGPFPIVILAGTCGGTGPHIYDWAQRLTEAGYAALTIDSFTPRGVQNNCKPAWQADVSIDTANADIAAAIAHLRGVPGMDVDRIAVAGFSFGAIAAIKLASASYKDRFGGLPGLRAVAFFYGGCSTPSSNPVARAAYEWPSDVVLPTIAFLGAIDNEVPPKPCAEALDRLKNRGANVSYKVYPETTHAFDEKRWGTEGRSIMHGTRGPFLYRYNPEATEDAWREMRTLFDKELKGVN